MLEYIIAALYFISLLFIFLFSLGQLHLTWHYLRSKKKHHTKTPEISLSPPVVTVQLPIYNEKYVVERLIDGICKLDYPKEKLEIQLLDDSTDQTTVIISRKVSAWQKEGINIQHIRRPDRVGFKAGALQYGLDIASGEFIAIFDADFLPSPDFLKKTIPVFSENTGMVQTRWGHLNKNYSFLTQLQAFGLDAHFFVEQSGRSEAGSFINFNGTGGVWRKTCIQDAGGWSADTLTEDLDLSYRAQMKGWQFKYLEDCVSPAELPVIMAAIKSQQYRWNKGAAETAKKNLWQVLRSRLSFTHKAHAFFHLFNSSVFVCILIAAMLSIPMLFIKNADPNFEIIFKVGGIFLFGFLSIALFYWTAVKQTNPKNTLRKYLKIFPVFIIVSMGLSLHNSIAVLEGLLGRKTPFIRTPKFNVFKKTDSWKNNSYIKPRLNGLIITEGLLSLYFIFGILSGIYLMDMWLMFFHSMLALGFASVFYYSVKSVRRV